MQTAFIESPLGITKIVGDEKGITEISVLSEGKITLEIPKNLHECVSQLREYFKGQRNHFDFKLNPQGTDFQQKVWQELLNIPYGKTLSYLELSKKLGDVKAIRAVASANGRNPLCIVVPCHRVIGTND